MRIGDALVTHYGSNLLFRSGASGVRHHDTHAGQIIGHAYPSRAWRGRSTLTRQRSPSLAPVEICYSAPTCLAVQVTGICLRRAGRAQRACGSVIRSDVHPRYHPGER